MSASHDRDPYGDDLPGAPIVLGLIVGPLVALAALWWWLW